jgi:predicted nucleotidyltransferase component of viral defense system
MKRQYDLDELGRKHGFNVREMEKVCRISDLLEDLSSVKFLRDRLCVYGGTAFTFIYAEEILRLSVDLDLNYRHLDKRDWGVVRDEIDERLKGLLYRQGYDRADIAISPSYPLTRFTVHYINTLGIRDNFRIEIGYLRRWPILKTDSVADFKHVGTQETFPTKTPIREELFANKWCTLLYRRTPRDLFDVYQTTEMSFDKNIFRKCAIIDSLMRKKPRLHEIDIDETIRKISVDTSLRSLLQTKRFSESDFNTIAKQTIRFSKTIQASIKQNEREAINQFFDHKKFKPTLIDKEGIFHEKIKDHPAILWALNTLT